MYIAYSSPSNCWCTINTVPDNILYLIYITNIYLVYYIELYILFARREEALPRQFHNVYYATHCCHTFYNYSIKCSTITYSFREIAQAMPIRSYDTLRCWRPPLMNCQTFSQLYFTQQRFIKCLYFLLCSCFIVIEKRKVHSLLSCWHN